MAASVVSSNPYQTYASGDTQDDDSRMRLSESSDDQYQQDGLDQQQKQQVCMINEASNICIMLHHMWSGGRWSEQKSKKIVELSYKVSPFIEVRVETYFRFVWFFLEGIQVHYEFSTEMCYYMYL